MSAIAFPSLSGPAVARQTISPLFGGQSFCLSSGHRLWLSRYSVRIRRTAGAVCIAIVDCHALIKVESKEAPATAATAEPRSATQAPISMSTSSNHVWYLCTRAEGEAGMRCRRRRAGATPQAVQLKYSSECTWGSDGTGIGHWAQGVQYRHCIDSAHRQQRAFCMCRAVGADRAPRSPRSR